MLNDCELAGFFEQLSFVQVGIENGFNALERTSVDGESALAGGFKSVVAKGFGQSEYAEAGSISKLWMLFAFHDSVDNALSRWADCGSPSGYAFRWPVAVVLMFLRSVLVKRSSARFDEAACMAGYALSSEENFYSIESGANFDLSAPVVIRHAIPASFIFDMIVCDMN